jgi:poly-gamma-glutamate synthesis protein (capsule biosynthesis protein)
MVVFVVSAVFADAQPMSGDSTRLSLLFIGDIMQHDTQIAAAFDPVTGKHDYSDCFQYVKPVLEAPDLTIGNLELTLGGSPYKGYPNFSAPDELITTLKAAGIDVLVTANNHSLDRGRKGVERTIAVLDTFAIPHTGTFIDSVERAKTYPLVIEKKGFRLSLLNYTYGTNGLKVTKPNVVNYIDTAQISKDIEVARGQSPDVVIVFLHWGDEYQSLPNKAQQMVARHCFNKGVQLVIGAHPHVLQPAQWNKEDNQLVIYSLGNFVSGQRPRYRNGGGMLHVELTKETTDSSSTTTISKAQYELQYIHRDSRRKKFFILPVADFEHDESVLHDSTSRATFRQFVSDSRALYAKHNKNITEVAARDSIFQIIAVLKLADTDSLNIDAPALKFYGVKTDTIVGVIHFAIGEFYDKEVAETALSHIREHQKLSGAVLMRRRKAHN